MPSFAGARELSGLLGLGRNLLGGAGLFVGPELFNQGRSGSLLDRGVQNLPGIIPDPRTDVGRNLGRNLGNELRYMAGQAAQGRVPYTQPSPGSGQGTGAKLRNYGTGYKESELAAGAAAERFRPGAGFPGQQVGGNLTEFTVPGTPGAGSFGPIDPYAAQNREYERERARVEAMVKANPDMQKQAIADERAKVRDQGMAIWAAKYGGPGGLASKVKPGAVGYDAIQQALIGKDAGQASRQAFGYQTPQQITLTPPPAVNIPQGFPAVQSIQPAEAYTTEGLQLDPEMRLKFQALLNLTNK
jgi:hypothetical protein